MKIKCRLVEAEQIISEMEERLIDVADDIAETEEDTQLIVSGWWVFLPQLNLQLHEGILCNWDEEEQMFMPDVAVTAFCTLWRSQMRFRAVALRSITAARF